MKQSLQLRLGQQLTMTPQLQQAIRLLQLSTLELRMEVQQALESNLMLESDEDAEETGYEDDALAEHSAGEEQGTEAATSADESEDWSSNESLGDDLALDSSWEDIYDGQTAYSAPAPEDEDRDPLANQTEDGESLHEYLHWQANLAGFTEREQAIAEAIIDAVDDDGYLTEAPEDLVAAVDPEWGVTLEDVESVRDRVREFDPVGVASHGPREALLIQLAHLPADTPWLEEARHLVDRHLELLANRQYSQLQRRMRLSQQELLQVVEVLQSLDPHPGARFDNQRTQYVVPDVFVRKVEGQWQVEINAEAYPRVRINNLYAGLAKQAGNKADSNMLRQHLQEARWFIKSLRSRNETLLKVARCIVSRQRDFLEEGDEAMKPLVLREVAEEIDMHESTVSRITNQKFMRTPRGTFEFKYFFSSHVQTVDGGECSATAIRARIRRLIADEDQSRPLSDSKLAELLQEEGINVARRTVAKYREAMTIASSTERKRLA
ncbi:RNA polymerase factor sigma-54 [Ectothiorhodospiraceae bacterium WFHF3C12]|nr:RNA polymerase factor sigma-54 [Ectothiorhodospiraceae bacterium WFHF3C12]